MDDDKMYLEALKHALSDDRMEVKTFPTGEECLHHIKEDEPKVVVLDYSLNSNCAFAMNGIQVLNKVKQSAPDAKVIMMSSLYNENIAMDSIKYGAYDYITKETNTMLKIKNTISHIRDNMDRNYYFDKQYKNLRRINIVILAVIIIAYVLNRIFL